MSESTAPLAGSGDVRPIVRTVSAGNRSVWLFGAVLLLAGFLIFQALSSRREMLAAPQTQIVGTATDRITAPPPLSLPSGPAEALEGPYPIYGIPRLGPASQAVRIQPAQPQTITRIVELPFTTVSQPSMVPAQPAFTPQPAVVLGNSTNRVADVDTAETSGDRVQASRLLNPAVTVPKGTVIAAVLETALDSSRAGAARAIVSRDVMGFDGTRILIPRGSRLYGEYTADVTAGQKRAVIRWQRLLRPDGVTIELDSPAADPLGRAGVEGRVNSNFLARFGGAILQSVLDIGVALATGAVTDDAVIVNMPQGTQQAIGDAIPPPPQPTLRVRQGTSVSVFVARDLDFSSVDS